MKYFLSFIIIASIISACTKEDLFSENSRHDLWLIHEGAKLPVVVEGNTQSKTFVILMHGGPGGSSQIFNAEAQAFSDQLEEKYAMVYYDQRNAGLALGEWEEETLTIEQHVEDLDMVIELLKHQFGDDIKLFLSGHSWGGYLGTAYLLDEQQAAKISAWININGLIHRNRNNFDVLERIEAIGLQQINQGINMIAWEEILADVVIERNKAITQYDVDSEDPVYDLLKVAENQITIDDVLSYNFISPTSSIYTDNYDPLKILASGARKETLRAQMYDFDLIIDSQINNISIPSLSIYGLFDVNTPMQQGEYFTENISTSETDKKLVLLNASGHSSMLNEPFLVAKEMEDWIERYK